MTTVDARTLTEAVQVVRDRYMATGRYDDVRIINAGECGSFASDVHEHLGGVTFTEGDGGLSTVGIDNFMHVVDDEPDGFDRDLLTVHWPAFVPPQGLDWDDLDRLAADAGFSAGTHEWIVLDGRHYDAEAPDGVDNPFDLPFFRRVVTSWIEERGPGTPGPRP